MAYDNRTGTIRHISDGWMVNVGLRIYVPMSSIYSMLCLISIQWYLQAPSTLWRAAWRHVRRIAISCQAFCRSTLDACLYIYDFPCVACTLLYRQKMHVRHVDVRPSGEDEISTSHQPCRHHGRLRRAFQQAPVQHQCHVTSCTRLSRLCTRCSASTWPRPLAAAAIYAEPLSRHVITSPASSFPRLFVTPPAFAHICLVAMPAKAMTRKISRHLLIVDAMMLMSVRSPRLATGRPLCDDIDIRQHQHRTIADESRTACGEERE